MPLSASAFRRHGAARFCLPTHFIDKKIWQLKQSHSRGFPTKRSVCGKRLIKSLLVTLPPCASPAKRHQHRITPAYSTSDTTFQNASFFHLPSTSFSRRFHGLDGFIILFCYNKYLQFFCTCNALMTRSAFFNRFLDDSAGIVAPDTAVHIYFSMPPQTSLITASRLFPALYFPHNKCLFHPRFPHRHLHLHR